MMELVLKLCWLALAALHVAPAAVLFRPQLLEPMYGVGAGEGSIYILLVHRGALFLAVLAAALFAASDPGSRRAATVVVAISVVGFLIVYIGAGLPEGPLRSVALADAVAIVPLAIVVVAAWRSG